MSSHESHEGAVHVHVSSARLYVGILGVLLALTALTVGVYQVHLGAANLAIAVFIATVKASLVVLYFMHLKYDTRFNALVFIGALLFMGLFLAYTVADVEYRGSVDPQYGTKVDPTSGEAAAGMDDSLREEWVQRARSPEPPAGEQAVESAAIPVPALLVAPAAPAPPPSAVVASDGGVSPEASVPPVSGEETPSP